MKAQIIAIGGVLLVGCGFAVWQQSRVETLRVELNELHEQAAQRGINVRMNASSGRRLHGITDRNSAPQMRKVTDLLQRMEEMERSGRRPDQAMYDRTVDALVMLMEMSPNHVRKLLAELRERPDLSDETKAKVIGHSLLFISAEHPEIALRIYGESKDLIKRGGMVAQVVGNALSALAEQDPDAAMQWVKSQKEAPVGMSHEEMRNSVLGGVAKSDPATAFRLLSTVPTEESASACDVIASALADTQRGRESLLQALKGYVGGLENPKEARMISGTVMEAIGRGVNKNSFQSVSQWLDSANLPESDIASFVDGLSWYSTGSETGEWINWMAQRLPGDSLATPVEGLVGDWVEEDYLAAGKWLTDLPDGAIKTPAVKAYAQAVAAYDPQVAIQWAMTIRDVNARRKTLAAIHENWPANDEAGAAKFAAEHGLE